ncbi:MAG: 3-deoxy-D-manno-octulosonic acid transferase [Ferrovum sp.]|nr:3-deoxy-D-manno-octulosonic acid transferase [Ferrovum sp.]
MVTTHRGYAILVWMLLPLAFIRLLWRSRRQPGYLYHWGERLGRYTARPTPPILWLHAVSVGETRAAASLIQLLRQQHPEYQLLLTHMTPTGRETAPELIGTDVLRCYLPYDIPFAIHRFLHHFKPQLGVLLETELWPNLISLCAKARVPVLLVNARLSEKSAARYQRAQPLTEEVLSRLSLIAAQTSSDAQRFSSLGAQQVVVAGNVLFYTPPAATTASTLDALHALVGSGRPVWLAASTRPGEERLLLELLPKLDGSAGLLILVPRHPQRFDEVAALLKQLAIPFVRRSENRPVPKDVSVLLGDSMGELQAYYQIADAALIGGSLLPFGGQNLIEATAVGCPVLVGPHTYNFLDATDWAIAAGAAIRLQHASELLDVLPALLRDVSRRQHMGAAGQRFTLQHQGAAHKMLSLIEHYLPPAP